jgi:hypothetical protein
MVEKRLIFERSASNPEQNANREKLMNNSNEFDESSNIIKNTTPQTLKYNEKTGKATKPSHLAGAADSADRIKDTRETLTPTQTGITDRQIAHPAPNEAEVSQGPLLPNTEVDQFKDTVTPHRASDARLRDEEPSTHQETLKIKLTAADADRSHSNRETLHDENDLVEKVKILPSTLANTETSNKPSVATKETVNYSPTRPEKSGDTVPPSDISGKKINNVNLVSPRQPLNDHFVSDAEQSDQNHLKLEKEGGAHRHDIVAPLGDQSPLASNTSFIELPGRHQSLHDEPNVEAPHADMSGVAANHQADHPETPLSEKTTLSLSTTALQHLQTEQQTTQELNKTIEALASRIKQRKSNH